MSAWRPSRAHRCLLFCLAALMGCDRLGPDPDFPARAESIAMPLAYQTWWEETESCSGRSANLGRIQWYVVPGVERFETAQGPRVGYWSHSEVGMRIVIAEHYVAHELVVRHEMLHALLDQEGHPETYFKERCRLTWETWQPK